MKPYILVLFLLISFSSVSQTKYRVIAAGQSIKLVDKWSELEEFKANNELVVIEPMQIVVYTNPKMIFDFTQPMTQKPMDDGDSYYTNAVDDKYNECIIQFVLDDSNNTISLLIMYDYVYYLYMLTPVT